MTVKDKHAQEMENATILLTDSNVNATKDSKENCVKQVRLKLLLKLRGHIFKFLNK